MQKNASLLAIVAVDTAENEPSKFEAVVDHQAFSVVAAGLA